MSKEKGLIESLFGLVLFILLLPFIILFWFVFFLIYFPEIMGPIVIPFCIYMMYREYRKAKDSGELDKFLGK